MTQQSALKIATLCDKKIIGNLPFHAVGDKYLRAITDYLQAEVIMLPANEKAIEMLGNADGLMLTGSVSNIEPIRYGEQDNYPDDLRDSTRDKISFALIECAIKNDIPILGICRGFQELNVALGGAMHQRIEDVEGLIEHREDKSLSIEEQYAKSHEVNLVANGVLSEALQAERVSVNSLHMQGIKRLAENLVCEATAADGLIEAFRIDRPDRFVLGVQWHPEWQVTSTPDYQVVFDVFEQACLQRTSDHSTTYPNQEDAVKGFV